METSTAMTPTAKGDDDCVTSNASCDRYCFLAELCDTVPFDACVEGCLQQAEEAVEQGDACADPHDDVLACLGELTTCQQYETFYDPGGACEVEIRRLLRGMPDLLR